MEPNVKMIDVEDSSQISQIGYNEETNILYIRFVRGALYKYLDVEPEMYRRFINAESKGSFFMAFIRDEYEFSFVPESIE